MDRREETTRIFALAKITKYEVTFENVSYTITLRECSKATWDSVERIVDYEINMDITFTEQYNFLYWMRNPAFSAMKESWLSGENDCYFEHISGERAAMMTLNGSVLLIPVVNS